MNRGRIPLAEDVTRGRIARAESDKTGNGNATLTFTTATRHVQVWNGGVSVLRIVSGGVTRYVPPGADTVEFPAPAASFAVTASGEWVARAME